MSVSETTSFSSNIVVIKSTVIHWFFLIFNLKNFFLVLSMLEAHQKKDREKKLDSRRTISNCQQKGTVGELT